MMFFGLLLYFFFTVEAGSLALQDESASNCLKECKSKFGTACERGCAYAYALTKAPKSDPFTPSCAESCKDFYSTSAEEVKNCIFGCDSYASSGEKSQPSWFSSILNRFTSLIGRIRGKLMPSQDTASENQLPSKPDEQSIVTRIRIFYFARPEEAEEPLHVLHPIVNDKALSVHSELQHGTNSDVLKGDREQRQIVDSSFSVSRSWQFACLFRSVFSNPMKLLFVITMVVLLVLLVAQFALCIRRQRRSTHYNYVALPTYAEAVDIKLPMDTNKEADGFTKGLKSSDA